MSRTPAKCRFVILFEARSGSSWLVSVLNGHEKVLCYPELFFSQDAAKEKELLALLANDGAVEEVYGFALDKNYFPVHSRLKVERGGFDAVGFKTKFSDITDPVGFGQWLDSNQLRVVYLKRKNLHKVTYSTLNSFRIMEKKRLWNLREKTDEFREPMTINPEEFWFFYHQRLLQEWRISCFLSEIEAPVLNLAYEDLWQNHDATMQRLYRFLDVPWAKTEGVYNKASNDDLRAGITNYDEVMAWSKHFLPQYPWHDRYADAQL